MNQKRGVKFLSLILAAAVFITFQLPFVQRADAASGKVTMYVPVSMTSSYTYNGKTTKSTAKTTYDKHGLVKTAPNVGKMSKVNYTRKNGLVTGWKGYAGKQLVAQGVTTIKNGKIVKQKVYDIYNSKKSLMESITYKYSGNTLVKVINNNKPGETKTIDYYSKKGVITKTVISDNDGFYKEVIKYDKYGNETYAETTFGEDVSTRTHTLKLDSHGNPLRDETTSVEMMDGKKETTYNTSTYKYTYKAGNITKLVFTSTDKNSKGKVTDKVKSVTTAKYRKYTVAKKFRNIARNDAIMFP